jgi:hypothetical protein
MVIFCTKPLSSNPPSTTAASEKQITFRKPVEKDFLGSNARRAYLMPKWEIGAEELKEMGGLGKGGKEKEERMELDILRKNDTDRLMDWQVKSAVGHWGVMRGVLPGGVWIDW